MRFVKKMQTQPRKVMWTADQVRLFCDTAYAEYKWRSIGLIVQMAYTFAQRIGDMRSLKWDSINFEERRLDLEQSKKRAEVHLPININMFRMLEQQHKDFGFQEFVAPHPFPRSEKNIKAKAIFNGSMSGYSYAEAFQLRWKTIS